MELTIKIQGDSEGYVTFECPFCGSEFKLQAGEYQDDEHPFEDLFCPYCGLTRYKNAFLSHEVIEQAQAMKELKDKDTSEVEFNCTCCNRHVKVLYCAGVSKIFCPYCGVDI